VLKQPPLSVIITAYTTERLGDIYDLLASLESQSLSGIETIFVAERSAELYEKLRNYAGNNPAMKVLFNDGEPGLSAARNVGIEQASGEIIAFIDDDVVLPPEWAADMLQVYQDSLVIGVTGPALPLWEDETQAWFPEELYWILSCTAWADWPEVREVRNAWGMNMSFRREAFERCGPFRNEFGFHKGPMAEDNEFSLRVRSQTGQKILYCPDAWLWHRVHRYRLSRQFIKERAYWIGQSRRTLRRHIPETGLDEANTLGQEHQLLKRIITRLSPSIAAGVFTNPVRAWRRFSVTFISLLYVSIGYYAHLLPRPVKKLIVREGAIT
jgi:GT2 family glycosyltransferase